MRRRGFTLIELMLVAAIVGVLAALSAYTLTAVNQLGRLNAASQGMATILRNARVRAITERCTYVVQINGNQYNPVAAPADVPRTPGKVLLWRKNDCAPTVPAYVPGLPANQRDRLVNEYTLSEFMSEVVFPAGVIAEPGNRLVQTSVSIAWAPNGARSVWADGDSDGASLDTGFALDLPMTFRPEGATAANPSRLVNVPLAGPAVAP